MQFYSYREENTRLTGRWDKRRSDAAVAVNAGAFIDLAFIGKTVLLNFDMANNIPPYPHLYISLDNSRVVCETVLDAYIRIFFQDDGPHILRIILKSTMEIQNRWYSPRQAKLSFRGIYADGSAKLPALTGPVIEFVGDSITEGVIIDTDVGEEQHETRCIQSDVTAGFAWKTAAMLNAIPVITGFGAQGITVGGNGGVPRVEKTYPYVYDLCPYTGRSPDLIVICHGTNDGLQEAGAMSFVEGYKNLLQVIRQTEPDAIILCLAPFLGVFSKEIEQAVQEYNSSRADRVIFTDTKDWVSKEPLHPNRKGTDIIARRLADIIKSILDTK
jgi:lysophospholipase L1-like esterase